MKRLLFLIAFFVGLIPNLKDMCLESAYCAKGQTLYNEEGEYACENPAEQSCRICNGCYDIMESYCPDCFFYCNECKLHYEESARHDHRDDTPFDESKYLTYYMCGDCSFKSTNYNTLYAHQDLMNHNGTQTYRRLSNLDD